MISDFFFSYFLDNEAVSLVLSLFRGMCHVLAVKIVVEYSLSIQFNGPSQRDRSLTSLTRHLVNVANETSQ
jgi:hypothetical protein